MLDNPFTIFDSTFVRLFFVFIGIAFLIYRFQLIIMIIDGFKNWRNRKQKYEADKLQFELDNLLSKNKINQLNRADIKFNLLNIVNNNNEYFVYFSYAGDTINIIDIFSKDFELLALEPKGLLKNNLSFYFRFVKIIPNNNTVNFEIICEDKFTNKVSKKYSIDIPEKTLKELN